MKIFDLQTKDIVSIVDGKRIGKIIDLEIDEKGIIINLIIESKKGIKQFLSTSSDITIKFSDINKIGEDVILVNL